MPEADKPRILGPFPPAADQYHANSFGGDPGKMIRPFQTEDVDRILEIEAQAFPKTAYPKEAFLYYGSTFPDGFVVIETDGEVAGYILFHGEGHIRSMAVKAQWRRKGLGRRLFTHAARSAKKRLWLEVRSENRGAIAFYRKMGMEIVGRNPGYYGDDDAFVMVLKENVWLKMRSLRS